MKTFITTLLMLVVSITTSAQFMPNDAAYNPAYEKVIQKNKVEAVYLVLSGSSEEEFNRNDTIKTVVYNEKGKPTYLVEPTIDEWDATYVDSFIYNDKGLLESVVLNGYDMFDITHQYVYDKKGNIISSQIDGAEARQYTYTTSKNKITEIVGKLAYMEVDDEGEYTGKVTWSDVERNVYEYDAAGRLSVNTYYYFDEIYSRAVYAYDAENRLVEEKTSLGPDDDEDTFYFVSQYRYGDDGLLESLTETNSNGVSYTYTYVYKKK
jgi:hypothetical protein